MVRWASWLFSGWLSGWLICVLVWMTGQLVDWSGWSLWLVCFLVIWLVVWLIILSSCLLAGHLVGLFCLTDHNNHSVCLCGWLFWIVSLFLCSSKRLTRPIFMLNIRYSFPKLHNLFTDYQYSLQVCKSWTVISKNTVEQQILESRSWVGGPVLWFLYYYYYESLLSSCFMTAGVLVAVL